MTAQAPNRPRSAQDRQRPRYHFTPPANWMNDPNGIIEWEGAYHLFYQHNPQAPVWDNMHWGHALSDDLVHWRDMPIALAPTPGSADADGCWSGCMVNDGGAPTILYTGVQGDWEQPENQRVCLARGSRDLVAWTKQARAPVIAQPPPGLSLTGFRDPFVWREGDSWRMAIGAGIRDVGGAVLLYQSKDLHRWEYLHPLCVGDMRDRSSLWTGTVWEVPQLHRLGDRHILLATVWNGQPLYSVYFMGTYRDGRYVPEAVHKFDFGDRHFYAAHAIVDSLGRLLVWGFIGEGRSTEAQQAAGWSGVMSLPRVLSLHDDGELAINPAPEIESLRREGHHFADIKLSETNGAEFAIDLGRDALEISVEIDLAEADEAGILLRRSPQGQEETRIFYAAAAKRLGIDRRRSTLDRSSGIDKSEQAGELALAAGETLRLRVFVDASVIEVYANERACLTSRVYPSRRDSTGLAVYARGGARVKSMEIWTLASIWD